MLLLNDNLLTSVGEAWRLPPTLYSCWKAQGSYHPSQFVLRLRPDVHRALETLGDLGTRTFSELSGEQIQAFSTYLHETIHWWQHAGSTLGFILSLLSPAHTHYNKPRLDEVLKSAGAFKSLRKHDAMTAGANGPAREAINVVLNNWHDMEFFRHLVCDPTTAARYIKDPYFDCIGHSFRTTISAVLWLLSATLDPDLKALPDPRKWEAEFQRLRAARQPGFYYGSDVHLPPLGARALFEGQARFSQIQYLHMGSEGRTSWEHFEKAGMLHGIYREAFDGFLTITGAPWPSTPADPLVGMFLLICDLSINPSEGFPCDLQHVPSVVLSMDPGMRFLLLCHAVTREKASFLGAITSYSKAEYLDVSERLCKALVCEPPVRIAETIAAWAKEHSTFAQLLIEEDTHEFSAGNLPIRVFFAQFLRFQLDKLADPQFFCWPGMWMCERAGTWDLENSQRLFNRHEALFMDGADGDVYPRVLRNKNAEFVTRTFDAFYSNVAAYELTRQWIVEDGPFELDFLWLTSQYSRAEVEDWASHIFEQSFGVRPDAFRIL